MNTGENRHTSKYIQPVKEITSKIPPNTRPFHMVAETLHIGVNKKKEEKTRTPL